MKKTKPMTTTLLTVEVPPCGRDYWAAVTDVPCPACGDGTVRWAEAGYVPGYRICDSCGQHWMAAGNGARPLLAPLTEQQPGCYSGAEEGEVVEAGQPYRWGAGIEPMTYQDHLNDMARTHVGDAGSPNIFFVTEGVDANVIALLARADYEEEAIQLARQYPGPAIVEDRQTGVVWENDESLRLQEEAVD